MFRASDTEALVIVPRIPQGCSRYVDLTAAPVASLHDLIAFHRRSIAVQMSRMVFYFFVSFTDPIGIDTLLILPLRIGNEFSRIIS